ncbi:hypothetical protein P3X46_035123 [Hevea brasiliensis]|uniref:Uncharacterized GPI-anchored protein At5g19230-like domain-containing protein n=1 Tax=Hevea brasiliensis TaxID=3981 RepID=A0ABQ9KDR2_HEVBR|nr:hypothetical protein P3X46_035123 [Hevea brasiliensis]
MASLKLFRLLLFVLLHAIFLLSSHVLSYGTYRTSLRLPALTKNENAGCLVDKVANKLENQPCNGSFEATSIQIDNYFELLSKCDIDINNTRDRVVLPVCVRKVPKLVITNYTRTQYAKYLNDLRFTGAGLGSEDDWMVVVLSTDTTGGNIVAGAISNMSKVGFGLCLVSVLVGTLVYVRILLY